jgi:DNA-binding transcriptional MerR regulator
MKVSGRLTIGAVAQRSGLTVKTLRFYSEAGLLPPSGRSAGGYRLYDEACVERLARIRTLRNAGLEIATIRAIFAGTLTLQEALARRLRNVEAELAHLRQQAAALRATLRSSPEESDLARLAAVVRLCGGREHEVIEDFFERISAGTSIDQDWVNEVLAASTPELPDEPTRTQLDAWIELCELVTDPAYVATLRAHAAEVWTPAFDLTKSQRANADATAAARVALDRGVPPESRQAAAIIERFVAAYADAMDRPNDARLRAWIVAQYREPDPRTLRYRELMAVLHGQPALAGPSAEWSWLIAAARAHLERPADAALPR